MTALPLSTAFTDSAVTEGEFKTAITNQREFLAGLLDTSGNSIDALRKLGVIGADTVTKSSAYTVVAADRGVVLLCSGTFTLSLTTAATLGDGFTFAIVNTGSGTITIDPSSTEQIDGQSTKDIGAGASAIITCTGTTFYTLGDGGGGVNTGVEIFSSNNTWVTPSGISKAIFIVIGGGGAGGFFGGTGVAGVGGNGGVAIALANVSGSYSVTIGVGGTGVSSGTGGSGGTTSISGSGLNASATGGGGGGPSPSGVAGANGTGTVSTGTKIRNSNASNTGLTLYASGNASRNSGGVTPVVWDADSAFSAGARATGGNPSNGGVGGAVVIIY